MNKDYSYITFCYWNWKYILNTLKTVTDSEIDSDSDNSDCATVQNIKNGWIKIIFLFLLLLKQKIYFHNTDTVTEWRVDQKQNKMSLYKTREFISDLEWYWQLMIPPK